jgi:hypothetical protein
MARGELMKKLLASYGRDEEFRAVAEANHHRGGKEE